MILQCYVHKTAEYKFNTQSGRILGGFSNLPGGGRRVAIPGDSPPVPGGLATPPTRRAAKSLVNLKKKNVNLQKRTAQNWLQSVLSPKKVQCMDSLKFLQNKLKSGWTPTHSLYCEYVSGWRTCRVENFQAISGSFQESFRKPGEFPH